MKQLFFSIAFLCSMFLNAQTTLKTNSSCDSNNDGVVNITDVTTTVNKVLGKAKTDSQVVTAEDLNEVLKYIDQQLDVVLQLKEEMSLIKKEYGIKSYHKGYEYVDLGLSVCWATMNVGATEVAGTNTNSHTGQLDCYGEYYAWGETSAKDTYSWSNLKYCNGTTKTGPFTKYVATSTYGTVDKNRTLELTTTCDDPARATWGGTWRVPTIAEIQELYDNCYWEWTTSYNNSGTKGYIVYKAKDASDKGKKPYDDGNSYITPTPTASYSLEDTHIFLPAAGYRYNSDFGNVSTMGAYMSSSLDESSSDRACSLRFGVKYVWCNENNLFRYYGISVRPVCP